MFVDVYSSRFATLPPSIEVANDADSTNTDYLPQRCDLINS